MRRTMTPGLLTDEQMASLGAFLDARLKRTPCDRTKRVTKEWILAEGEARRAVGILRELERRGGCCCDCEVLHNVIGIPPGDSPPGLRPTPSSSPPGLRPTP